MQKGTVTCFGSILTILFVSAHQWHPRIGKWHRGLVKENQWIQKRIRGFIIVEKKCDIKNAIVFYYEAKIFTEMREKLLCLLCKKKNVKIITNRGFVLPVRENNYEQLKHMIYESASAITITGTLKKSKW